MEDRDKTKEQLTEEMAELRQRLIELEKSETHLKWAEEALRESEARLEATVESLPFDFFALDANGCYIVQNSVCKGRWGDLIGRRTQDVLVGEEALAVWLDNNRRAFSGETVEGEVRYTAEGKEEFYYNVIAPIRDEGQIRGIVGINMDITERKQAEEERTRLLARIQEQARQVQQIVDTVPEGMLLLDADGQVVLANPVAENALVVLAGVEVRSTLAHLGDRPLAELLTSPPEGLWHEVAANGRSFEVIARPLETGPETKGWVLVIRDVTRERDIQRRVQQQERLAAVGQLAAGIAHDFNNIMATIVLYAQMTSRTPDLSNRDRERLGTINQQAQHATRLIQQILDFSRRAVLERRPLDLVPFLKEQVKLLERTLPESIKIKLAYGHDEYTVNADPTRMQQVVMNLALNARDAMPEGGELCIGLERIEVKPGEPSPLPEMKVAETAVSAWVRVTVSDSGMGIPPDDLAHIFEPFFTTKEPGQGSGLGLAQVYGIVGQHEGHIDVESQAGADCGQSGGTTFTIYLPALSVHPLGPLALELPALAQGQGETILVVEDSTSTRKALVESLKLLNYRVLEAANGREALEALEQRRGEIALVLSDVVMPGMGGIALLESMRKRGLEVRMVLLTGHPLGKGLEDLRAQGADSLLGDCLFKPPSLEQLAEAVARGLRGNQIGS